MSIIYLSKAREMTFGGGINGVWWLNATQALEDLLYLFHTVTGGPMGHIYAEELCRWAGLVLDNWHALSDSDNGSQSRILRVPSMEKWSI